VTAITTRFADRFDVAAAPPRPWSTAVGDRTQADGLLSQTGLGAGDLKKASESQDRPILITRLPGGKRPVLCTPPCPTTGPIDP
jgi:hypothetical protein